LGLDLRLEVAKRGFKSDLGFFRVSVVVDGGRRGSRKLGSAVEHRRNLNLGLEGGTQGRFHGPASLGTCPGLAQIFLFFVWEKEKKTGKKNWKKGKMGKPTK
jgi:hypothetical protein